jgi:hypothetical protein
LVNPAYWDVPVQQERERAPKRRRDCVGHQPNWNTRLGMIERLDAIGVGEIIVPSHVTSAKSAISLCSPVDAELDRPMF